VSSWSLDPLVAFTILAPAMLYYEGLQRMRRAGTRRPPRLWRRVAFFGGLLVIIVALESPLDGWADRLLWVHMVQHELLIMVAAPLLVMGAPLLPWLQAIPVSLRRAGLGRWSRHERIVGWTLGSGRLIGNPWVVLGGFVGDLVAWHVPPLYDLALAQPPIHHLEHALFFATALLFWIQLIPSRPFQSKLTSGQRALYLGAAAIAQDLLDLVFVLAPVPVYEFYASLPRGPENASALADQSIAAGVMELFGMGITGLAFVLLLRATLVPRRFTTHDSRLTTEVDSRRFVRQPGRSPFR
jgi:putative membrane protein